MDEKIKQDLLAELIDLQAQKSPFVDDEVTLSPVERYISPERFQAEQDLVFRTYPLACFHASELARAYDFVTCQLAGLPVLISRGKDGVVRAFLNVCRHRGSKLVAEQTGQKKLFSCPYHAWTYETDGTLRRVPHGATGFPSLDQTRYGLHPLSVVEKLGLIWVVPNREAPLIDPGFFDPIDDLLGWLSLQDYRVAATTSWTYGANWKILIEGGLEAYHFKVAHRQTIGPHFIDNLSSYQAFGTHLRSILPRETLSALADQPRESWSLRDHANILYTIFPCNQFLVMQDHIAWLNFSPLSESQTEVCLRTLVPQLESQAADQADDHWTRNHAITTTTLREDFDIGENIQAGLSSMVNQHLTFGRFEGALDKFNQFVEQALVEK